MIYIAQRPKPLTVACGQALTGLQGYMRVQIRRPDGRVRWDSGFFPNRILNNGRNNMATQANWLTNCHVGTGSTVPTSTDTQLEAFVVQTSTVVSNTDGTQGSAPYYGWRRKTFRFAQGAGHGGQNLSEAGIGWSTTGSVLISRALIIDPQTQQPTTVTPLTDEILDVTYELRYYPYLGDVLNSVTLAGVNYDTITRAASVTGNIWSDNIGVLAGYYSTSSTYWPAYDGLVGNITQFPSGNIAYADDGTNAYNIAYSNNSYERRIGITIGTSGWNLGAGIRCLALYTEMGAFQTQFSANPGGTSIPKNTNYTMQMEWVIRWAAINVTSYWNMIAASDSTTPAAGEWNTNLAGTTLRVNWDDNLTNDFQTDLKAETGSVFRIIDDTDDSKWVEYTVGGAYTEGVDYTSYPVTQTAISNSGPTVGNQCTLRNITL